MWYHVSTRQAKTSPITHMPTICYILCVPKFSFGCVCFCVCLCAYSQASFMQMHTCVHSGLWKCDHKVCACPRLVQEVQTSRCHPCLLFMLMLTYSVLLPGMGNLLCHFIAMPQLFCQNCSGARVKPSFLPNSQRSQRITVQPRVNNKQKRLCWLAL